MMKPDISLFGSAATPSNWMIQLESMGNNVAKWERICVGPFEPDYTLPDNVRFIKTGVKPVQCNEIAARESKSDIIMHLDDDFYFQENPHPLDCLLNLYWTGDNRENSISPAYMLMGVNRSGPYPNGWMRLIAEDNDSPALSCQGLMAKELHISLGGFDRNLMTNYYDNDLSMRIWANGGEIIITQEVIMNEATELRRTFLSGEHWQLIDRKYLEYLWIHGGDWRSLRRAVPVDSFSDDRIREESQGPKGRWA